MVIERFRPEDAPALFDLLAEEGAEWSDYHGAYGRGRYLRALETSATYLAWDGGLLCGYVRCREDGGFGVYVCDLLVRASCRGSGLGRRMMARVREDFQGQTVYVMSDVDPYYETLGYRRVGSIFEVDASR